MNVSAYGDTRRIRPEKDNVLVVPAIFFTSDISTVARISTKATRP